MADHVLPTNLAARSGRRDATQKGTSMPDVRCSDVVRVGGDVGLGPERARDALAAHLSRCPDCSSYASQIATTRDLLGRRARHDQIRGELARGAAPSTEPTPTTDVTAVRDALLTRAGLLDPSNAEDLTQRALEVGFALQRRDSRPRGTAELAKIMHTLSDAQARLDGRTAPAVDVNAAARARADSLDDFDSDADEPELFYPDLYPSDDGIDGWVDSPNQWRGGAQIPGPEEVDETRELYDVLDEALGELPEPLGELVALVDLQGYGVSGSGKTLGLDEYSATAALARARNHVRGRLNEYFNGSDVTVVSGGTRRPGGPADQ